jgi:hypothetical protein
VGEQLEAILAASFRPIERRVGVGQQLVRVFGVLRKYGAA